MKYIDHIKKGLNFILKILLVMGNFTLLSLLGIEVFFRYILNDALSWPGEVAGFVFVWFTLLGTALLVGDNSHIAFSLISLKSSVKVRKSLYILTQISIIIYAYFMVFYGFKYAKLFSFAVSPAAGIKMVWLYSSVPVSGVFVVLYALINMSYLLFSKKDN